MNESIIRESFLKKDIELLTLYSEEEKEKYKRIIEVFNSSLKCYNSPNTPIIKKKLLNIFNNIPIIIYNRSEYSRILQEVIKRYNITANKIIDSANKFGGDINV